MMLDAATLDRAIVEMPLAEVLRLAAAAAALEPLPGSERAPVQTMATAPTMLACADAPTVRPLGRY